jgi:ABC-2 type transport system permease protein
MTTVAPASAPTPAPSPVLTADLVPEPGADRSGAHLVADTLVFAGRHLQHIRQIPEKLLDVTLQPLMFVLLFAYVFGGAIAVQGGNYREYIIGGILIQSLAFGLTGPATAIATDLTEGVVDRFRSLPTTGVAYLLGHYLAELAGMVLSMVILLGAGLVVGWRVHTDAAHVLVAFALLLAFASAMIWVGTAIGLLVRTPDAVMGVAFVVIFPLTFLSSAFVPIATLPEVLQWVASWNPVSIVVGAVRQLFGNPTAPVADPTWPLQHPVPAAFVCCAVILLVAVPVTLHRYRTRTRD